MGGQCGRIETDSPSDAIVHLQVIDEVSMLSAEFFQIIEEKLRAIRGIAKPAGGLQIIVCGDFFQLPPVTKRVQPGMPKVKIGNNTLHVLV